MKRRSPAARSAVSEPAVRLRQQLHGQSADHRRRAAEAGAGGRDRARGLGMMHGPLKSRRCDSMARRGTVRSYVSVRLQADRGTIATMELQSLGYIGIRASDVDEWADYGSKFLGMQLVDRSRSTLTFRMDDRRQRVVVQRRRRRRRGVSRLGSGRRRGARCAGGAARTRPACACGGCRRRWPTSVASRRCIRFEDPAGNVLEAFHGAEIASDPFRPGRAISGFRTGPLGMGHVVMNVERIDACCRSIRICSDSG